MFRTCLAFLYPAPFRLPFQPSRQKSARLLQRQRQSQSQCQFQCLCFHSRGGHRAATIARLIATATQSSSFQARKIGVGTLAVARAGPIRIVSRRSISTTAYRSERLLKRHGKAVEPFLADGESADGVRVYTPRDKGEMDRRVEGEIKTAAVEGEDVRLGSGKEREKEKDAGKEPSYSVPLSGDTQNAARLTGEGASPIATSPGGASGSEQTTTGRPEATKSPTLSTASSTSSSITPPNPLERVLYVPPPETAEEENASKPPHLQTPPYVHHFDTYTLVKQVEAGGFSNEQSVTSMKAVRGLLALNLEVARKGLVSKSDVENETYLFRAACSELKTEIQNTRKKNEEAMRRERTLLQHEVDILNQKLSQELLTLKDDLKGMFDDRKMSVRMEQRTMESKIQELNYKITVLLNSDSKSEIEGLRWVLTRRSVMGILFMAFMVLTSLRYASYKSHEDEMRAKKKEELMKVETGEVAAQGAAEILAAN